MDSNNYGQSTLADFRMLYQVTIDDIRYIKGRQWVVTYYLLLLFAAIIGFSETIGLDQIDNWRWEKLVLSGISVGIAILGICFLIGYQKTLAGYRRRLVDNITPNLSGDFQKSLIESFKGRYKKADRIWCKKDNITWCKRYDKIWCKKYTSFWKEFFSFTIYLILMLLFGAFFICWYLFLGTDCPASVLFKDHFLTPI